MDAENPWRRRFVVVLAFVLATWAHGAQDDGSKREVLVKEMMFDTPVSNIEYLGKNHDCILATSKSKRLYYSTDAGQQWQEITNSIDSSQDVELQADRVIVNRNDKSVAVLQTNRRSRESAGRLGGDGGKWWPYTYITEDSGKTWRKAWGKHHGLHSWISHPTKRDWALVSWWTGDCDHDRTRVTNLDKSAEEDEDTKTDKEACVHRLMVTRDLGKNFVQIAAYVVQFSWGNVAQNQGNRVYYTSYKNKKGDQGKLSLWTSEVDFYHADISATGRPYASEMTIKHGNKFLVSGDFILVAQVTNDAAQTVKLKVSRDGGKTFQGARLPSGLDEMEERWYAVIDTSEGAVIIHVNSNDDGTKDTGRIYISDSEGWRFTQSLENNVRSGHGECEFDKVVSLTGVYIANVVVPEGSGSSGGLAKEKAEYAEKVEKEASDGTQLDKKHGRGFGISKKTAKEERTIRTVISFNKGGAWTFLKPPRVDSVGKPFECANKPIEECSLHLHGTTTWDFYAPFYSTDNSVGLIMGTGNVGSSLRFEPEETDTFLSRDGGLTWIQAHKGAFIYEFGDHGGLIVMADDLKKTSEVVFTWNEGQSWYDFKVSKTPFEVDNIISEPNLTSTTFVMFGSRDDGVGVLYYMKFDALQFPLCRGVWAADSVSSDYETWTPSDGVNKDNCMLGQQLTYTRRKRTSSCWNGEQFERAVTKKICSCTQEDFACETGFTRELGSMECKYGGVDMLPKSFIPTACSSTFKLDAYRKVPGDVCEGGWQPELANVPCPSAITPDNMRYAIAGVFIVFVSYLGYQKFCTGGGPSSKVTQSDFGEFTAKQGWQCQTPLALFGACFGWVHGKLTANTRGFEGFSDLTYKKLTVNEFEFESAGGNEESLTGFLDEAEQDDFAPPVYDGGSDKKSAKQEESSNNRRDVVTGGVRAATESVPRLQAPPGSAIAAPPATNFGLITGDDDLL
eukprot:TRINITY_DN50794_c0_g1_i1.p1 TRINITY_DN50794_c0_g1~~TRINITY_DN50794_c0_g1_i1.p1  ORF type:complete len:985 (-),score=196.18 TRINITY_DN50794_c0_g1_i1:139-3018(-)